MANITRIKRRAVGGAIGAPSSLVNAELAYNEQEDVLYYGKGTGGAGGTATNIVPIAGVGAVVDRSTAQSIAGVKTFASSPILPTPVSGDNSAAAATTAFVKNQNYLAGGTTTSSVPEGSNLYFTNARASAAAPVQTVAGRNGNVTLAVADVSGAAPLASPALTGTPTTPTAAAGTNSTQAASTAFVQAAITAVVGAAPAALDTLVELANSLNNDANIAGTLTTSLATKLTKASNLADLTDVAVARSNLSLGSMALQNANNVAISGGTIDNITIDGGTF
ncbi:MAG: hypothetical protein WBI20_14785 [Burkholderiaceae bacterium]